MISKSSKILLWISLALLIGFASTQLATFLHLVYRMRYHGESLETLMKEALVVGRLTAPVLIIGLTVLAAYGFSRSRDARGGTTP